jgi:hypothetical protein
MRVDPPECGLDVLGDRQQLTSAGAEFPSVGGGHEHPFAVGLLERGDAPGHGRVVEAEAVCGGRELAQAGDREQGEQILGGDLRTGSAGCIGSHSAPILSACAHITGAQEVTAALRRRGVDWRNVRENTAHEQNMMRGGILCRRLDGSDWETWAAR